MAGDISVPDRIVGESLWVGLADIWGESQGGLRRVQATQRAGRAGRTRNGKCYRLYTQKCFERDMPAETLPEIQRTSMLTAVLFLKSLPLDIDVLAFDYLDHPGVSQLPPLRMPTSVALPSDASTVTRKNSLRHTACRYM